MFQRLAAEALHRDEQVFFVLANLVDRANVGMIEGGGGASFSAETLQRLRILQGLLGQELQSYQSSQTNVLGLVDDAHSSAAKLFNDAVMRDGFANHSGDGSLSGRFILRT